MSTGKLLVIVSDSLAAIGLLAGVVVLLAFFTFAAIKESALTTSATPLVDGFSPATSTSPASSPVQALSNLPPLPLEINAPFRHLSGGGYIAQVHNTSAKALRIVVTLESDATHSSKTEALAIPASGTIEIGWDQDWSLDSGDRMRITCDDYQTGTWTMP